MFEPTIDLVNINSVQCSAVNKDSITVLFIYTEQGLLFETVVPLTSVASHQDKEPLSQSY